MPGIVLSMKEIKGVSELLISICYAQTTHIRKGIPPALKTRIISEDFL